MEQARRDGAWARLKARLRRGLTTGVRDERGATAVMFAVSLVLLIPLTLGVFEVYYGAEQRGKLQDSLDAAALFAARSTAITTDELTTIGRAALDANLQLRDGAILKSATFRMEGQKVIAVASLQPASLMGSGSSMFRYPDITVTTEVNRAMDKLEIALVLDNTGSMQGTKLATLKTAAKDLVDKLKAASERSVEVDPIKIALVPFSNTVRVQGTTSLANYDPTKTTNAGIPSWIDPKGQAHLVNDVNYDNFNVSNVDRFTLMKNMTRSGTQLSWEGCVEARRAPYDVEETPPTTTATMYTPWFWPDEADQTNIFQPTGSSTWYAGSYNDYINDTPLWTAGRAYNKDDIVTYVASSWSSSTAYAKDDIVSYVPPTWSSSTNYVTNDLVIRSGVQYRAKSNNKNKQPPDSTYWATDTTGSIWRAKVANTNKAPNGSLTNWTLDATASGGTWRAASVSTGKAPNSATSFWVSDTNRDTKARQRNTPKYGNTVSGTPLKNTGASALDSTGYGATGSYVYGPNMGCALQPVISLTTSMTTIKTAIDAMTAIGETNIPIGLAWGWNALSPGGPLANGSTPAAYGTAHNRKIIILMTDGENTMNNPSKSQEINGSFYGGYGYIWQKMLGVTSSSDPTTLIDNRLSLLCTNLKAKGITLYTVRVEVSTGSSSLLQNCASSPDKFYDVQNVSQLGVAFDAIARSIDNLRISK